VLVVDANVAVKASFVVDGFRDLGEGLVGPSLMWSEGRSVLRQLWWRGELRSEDAEIARVRFESCPIDRLEPPELPETAWRLAVALGWAKTYDAEYLALASLLGCQVVTIDARLRRGADRLGLVISPEELL
jgi:predicted nucleic acid-binding protein